MANYYTYGQVPSVSEVFQKYAEGGTVYGTDLPSMTEEKNPSDYDAYYGGSPGWYAPGGEGYGEFLSNDTESGLTIGSFFQPGLTLPADIDPNKLVSSIDPLAIQRGMASASLIDPAAFSGFSGFSADPNVAAGAFRRADTRAGFGSAGSLYEEGALEQAKAMAQMDPTQGLWGAGYKSLLEEDPATQAAIDAMQQRGLTNLARYEQNFPVMQQLSKLLKENKFNEAFAFARENNALDALMSADSLRELRPAFTQSEMKAFFDAIPKDYAGAGFDYKPDVGYQQSVDPFGTGTSMELGYPDPTGAFKRKDDKTMENLVKAAALAMVAGTFGPGLIGGSSAAAPTAAGATGAGATGFTPGLAGAQMAGSGIAGGAAGGGALTAAQIASILPEVVVTASKPALSSLLAPAAAGAVGLSQLAGGATAPTTTAPTPEPVVEQPLEPLEEVVIQSQRPVIDAGIAAGVGTGAAAESALNQAQQAREPTYEEPPMEEVVVEGTKPEIPLSEALAGAGALDLVDNVIDVKAETPKPTEIPESPLQKLQALADKVGGWSNALRILGGLGGLLSGGQKPTAAPAPAAPQGFGGALPKYEFTRQQLQPDIDYYRYGLGPEAKFFEDRMTKVEPAPAPAPATGIVNPEDQPVFAKGGLAKGGRYMEGAGSGRDDKIPALLSDGEYVIDAETLALLGDGSTKEGAKRMDEFRAKIRKHKGRALSRGRISPDAKSPSKYMGGGLT